MNPLIKQLKERIKVSIPPATVEQIEAAEQELGFKLPRLLQEIYSQVANGGFGPGYGILGLPPNGATDDEGETVVSLYGVLPIGSPGDPKYTNPDFEFIDWPEALLPICYYGGNSYACLDCSKEDGPILIWSSGKLRQEPHATSLEKWLNNWLDLKMP